MSENVNESKPNEHENAQDAPQPSSEAPDGAQAATTEAPPAEPSVFRYAEDDPNVPSWARGKTADDILRTASDLYGALQRGETSSPAPETSNFNASSEPQMTPPSGGSDDVDPNLLYSDPAAYTRQLRDSIRREMRAEMGAASASITTPLASMAKHQAMQNPKRKLVWDRYAPEIETIVAKLPEAARARPEIWDEAARMVAGDKLDELADIRAREIMQTSGDAGMLPTQGGPAAPSGAPKSPLDKLFADKDPAVKGFLADGIDVSKVRAHYRKRGYTSDEDIVSLLTRKKAKASA